MGVLLLKPNDLQGLVSMKDAIDAVEQGYRESTEYPVINGPRRRVHSPSGVRVSNFPGGFTNLALWVRRFVRSWLCRKATINATIIANCRFMYCMTRQAADC